MHVARTLIACVGSVCLAVTLVATGFAAVAVPDAATVALSHAYSGTDNPRTPFSEDELTALAVAGKHYTFDDNDQAALDAAVTSASESAAAEGRTADAHPALSSPAADERVVLGDDAMSHLDDVYRVVSVAKPALAAVAAAAAAALIVCGLRGGRRVIGRTLAAAGGGVLALFAVLGGWAALDFNGLFAVFHSLFFQAGTWTFPNDSLLITLYPTAFWVGMGGIWLAVTGALSILCLIVGSTLITRARKSHL